MLGSVKEILNREVDVKDILTKEIHIKEFLEMEIELTKLKQLLATEIKLKEFLVQEIDLSHFLSNKSTNKQENSDQAIDELVLNAIGIASDTEPTVELIKNTAQLQSKGKAKRDLPAYDFSLVDSLHEEHKEIRFIYNRLMSFSIEKDYAKVAGQLATFNTAVREHYQKTDTELYAYLRTYVQLKYPKREKAFTQLSLEMKNISIEIFYIISQSPNIPLSEKTYDVGMKEFMAVGKLMNDRINREKELLFKMYEQTNAATSIS